MGWGVGGAAAKVKAGCRVGVAHIQVGAREEGALEGLGRTAVRGAAALQTTGRKQCRRLRQGFV